MISSLDSKAHFGGPFFGWKSENVAGWPNTDLEMLEIDPATCPNGQLHGTFETARYRYALIANKLVLKRAPGLQRWILQEQPHTPSYL